MQLSTGIETQKERTLAMLEDKEYMCWLFERYGRFIWYTVKNFAEGQTCGRISCRKVCSAYYHVSRGYGT